jgi:hypothetical protein
MKNNKPLEFDSSVLDLATYPPFSAAQFRELTASPTLPFTMPKWSMQQAVTRPYCLFSTHSENSAASIGLAMK